MTVSPLQMEIFAGTKTRRPESSPILTSLVSAANAGCETTLDATPAARAAARAMAWRRSQRLSLATTVLRFLLRSTQSRDMERDVLMFFLRLGIMGD